MKDDLKEALLSILQELKPCEFWGHLYCPVWTPITAMEQTCDLICQRCGEIKEKVLERPRYAG